MSPKRFSVVVLLLLLFVFLTHGYAQRPDSETRLADQYNAAKAFERADSLLSSGQESAAIEAYKDMLVHAGVKIPKDEDYKLIKPETVIDSEFAGEILGRIARANLRGRFEETNDGPMTAEESARMALRHRNGANALRASISLLEYARGHIYDKQFGPFSLDERIRINRKLRSDYDLLIESFIYLTQSVGEKDVLLAAFAKVLQSRSRVFLEAVWSRRAIARLNLKAPRRDIEAYRDWLSAGYRFGYLLSALRREKSEQEPRTEVVNWLEQEGEAALAELRQRSKTLMERKNQRGVQKLLLQKVPSYPDTVLGAGFLVRPGLTGEEVLVQYHITDSNVYAFVFPVKVKNVDNVEVVRLNVPPEVLARNVTNYLEKLKDETESWKPTSKELYLEIFAALNPYLQGKKRVFIVPSGILNRLPFQTLIDPQTEEPAILRHEFSLLPNAELLGPLLTFKDEKSPQARAIVVGVGKFKSLPNLAQSESEATEVGSALGKAADVFLASRGEATREAVLRALPKYSIIHLSSHVIFDRRAMYSRVILKDQAEADAPITGFDFLNPQLKLLGGLVTLSACDSGTAEVDEGEDALGLTPALFIAGARVVVASMWQVEEKSTSLLMVKFYEGLRRGKEVDDAMYEAETWLRSEHLEYSHPHFWGSFVVIGDGRFKLSGLGK